MTTPVEEAFKDLGNAAKDYATAQTPYDEMPIITHLFSKEMITNQINELRNAMNKKLEATALMYSSKVLIVLGHHTAAEALKTYALQLRVDK